MCSCVRCTLGQLGVRPADVYAFGTAALVAHTTREPLDAAIVLAVYFGARRFLEQRGSCDGGSACPAPHPPNDTSVPVDGRVYAQVYAAQAPPRRAMYGPAPQPPAAFLALRSGRA